MNLELLVHDRNALDNNRTQLSCRLLYPLICWLLLDGICVGIMVYDCLERVLGVVLPWILFPFANLTVSCQVFVTRPTI